MNPNIDVNAHASRPWGSIVLTCAALLFGAAPSARAEPPPRVDPALYRVVTEIEGLERPWSLAFLPDGRRLVTEAVGRLRVVGADGTLDPAPVSGLPPIYAAGQGGLMDVAVDPDFAKTGRIFLTFLHGDAEANNVRLVSARLEDGAPRRPSRPLHRDAEGRRLQPRNAASPSCPTEPSRCRWATGSTGARTRRTPSTRSARSCGSAATGRSRRTIRWPPSPAPLPKS